ncbi:MAG: ATP-binding protein, partial [Bacilli bacterium]
KQRFGKRINVTYNLLVGEFKVPPLTIQPLVENAVKHGISKKREGGTIFISSTEDNNFIYVSIADNGIGFELKNLPEKQRVGTQNIRHRLNLHLNATLEINSQINEGTIATIKIPKK